MPAEAGGWGLGFKEVVKHKEAVVESRYLESLPEPGDIQVVVLMGGLGSRLGEQTKECPKTLMEVEGKPFFDYQLKILKEYGFRTFLFLVGYRGEMVEAYYGDGSRYGVEISYSYDGGAGDGMEISGGSGGGVEISSSCGGGFGGGAEIFGSCGGGSRGGVGISSFHGGGSGGSVEISGTHDGGSRVEGKLLGTGGAVRRAYKLLRDDFLLLYGDSFMDIDYRETIYRYFRGKLEGCRALMTVMENNNRLDRSNVIYEDGKIVLYDKAAPDGRMKYIDYGAGMFEKGLFAEGGEVFSDIADLQHKLSVEGKLAAHEVTNRFYEIGTPGSLEEFRKYAHRRFGEEGRAVFFDRDGVVNEIVFREETGQLDSPFRREEVELTDGAAEAMRALQEAGYYLFIVTNQPGAAKGKTGLADLYDINTYICRMLAEKGVYIDGVEICPHYPGSPGRDGIGGAGRRAEKREKFLVCDCRCRKPKTGMIDALAGRFCIDKGHSWMVGDSYTDVLAGRGAGLKTAFIGSYKCDVCKCLGYVKPDLLCGSAADFVSKILPRLAGNRSLALHEPCKM